MSNDESRIEIDLKGLEELKIDWRMNWIEVEDKWMWYERMDIRDRNELIWIDEREWIKWMDWMNGNHWQGRFKA